MGTVVGNGAPIIPMAQRTQFDGARFLPGARLNYVLLSKTSMATVGHMAFVSCDSPQLNRLLGTEVIQMLDGLFRAKVITGVACDGNGRQLTVRLNLVSTKNTAALTFINAVRYGARLPLLEWADVVTAAEVTMGTTTHDKTASGGKLLVTIEQIMLEAINRLLLLLG